MPIIRNKTVASSLTTVLDNYFSKKYAAYLIIPDLAFVFNDEPDTVVTDGAAVPDAPDAAFCTKLLKSAIIILLK